MGQHSTIATRQYVSVAVCLLALFFCARVATGDDNRAKRVGFSILEDYDKGEDLAEVAKDFALFRELGVTTWRGSFGWDDVWNDPPRDLTEWERFVRRLVTEMHQHPGHGTDVRAHSIAAIV